MGQYFNGTFFNSLKFYREGGIPDNYGIIGTQMIGSGGLGIGSLGSISECIENGVVFRIDENTIYFLYTSEIRYEGINIFFCLVNENGEPVDTTLTAQTNKTIVTTNTYITNSDSFQFHNDENGNLIVDRCDILVDSPSNWEIQTNIALTGSEILMITNGEATLGGLVSELLQMGVGFIAGTKLTIGNSFFSMLKNQGLTTIGLYLFSSDQILIEANNIITNSEPVIDFKTLFTPYFFETNGQHKVEFEVFKNMFLTNFETSQFAFNGSCVTYFSEDAFCEMRQPFGFFLEDCKYLKEFTIPPRNFPVDYYRLPIDGALEKVNLKGEYIKSDNGVISKVINGTYILAGSNNNLSLCLDKSYSIQIPPEIKNIGLFAFNHLKTMEYLTIPNKSNVDGTLTNNYVKVINYYNNYLPGNINSTSLTEFNNYADDIKVNYPTPFYSSPNVKFYGNATSDGKCLLSTNKELKYYKSNGETAYTIPDEVRIIDSKAFKNDRTLTYIVFPDGIQIEDGAFSGCTWLEAVRFNGKMKAGNNVFSGCTGLSVVAYDSLESLFLSEYGSGRSNPTYIGAMLYIGRNPINPVITVPETMTKINKYTFAGCDQLNVINIHDGVKEIMQSAFYEAPNLREVNIGSGVETIGSHAFRGTALTSITIPENVTFIDKYAFHSCTSLQEIHLPSQIKEIGERFFWKCQSLKNVEIPSNVEYIGYAAFSGCTSLEEIIIPSSVRKIDDHAFSTCLGLKTVTVNEGTSEIGQYALYLCRSLIKLELPSTLTKIGGWFMVGAQSLTEITCYATTAPVLDGLAFGTIATHGKLKVPAGSDYSSWMKNEDGYLGRYNWTIEYI